MCSNKWVNALLKEHNSDRHRQKVLAHLRMFERHALVVDNDFVALPDQAAFQAFREAFELRITQEQPFSLR